MAALGGLVGLPAGAGWAQTSYTTEGGAHSAMSLLADRLEFTLKHMPALGEHLLTLPGIVGGRTLLLLIGIVVVGLAAEYVVRAALARVRARAFDRVVGRSQLRAFGVALVLDIVALLALAIAARVVFGQIGDRQGVAGQLGQQVMQALIYWRLFNVVFRAWLRPGAPDERIAPVDSDQARRLLVALNWVIVLPLLGSYVARALVTTGANRDVTSAAIIIYAPLIAIGLLAVVWRWRDDMAAWLSAMVSERKVGYRLKLDAAKRWWMFGLAFYAAMGLAAVYSALTETNTAARGLTIIETVLIALLLFETLMHRLRHHIATELPMAADVVADCLRLIARLYVAIVVADALMVKVLGAATAAEWAAHDRGAKLAAVTLVAIYAFWRFVRYRMDSYIAANPLPSADMGGEDDGRVAASRLRTLMPLLRVVAGATIAVVGGLVVLSELGVNITPLIAGASVFGLAISFGSQALVRDIVSGIFFLAEDSFRIGEYVDCSKVKGTVEGFSVRSLKLRHQNGQLHIVPFGQVGHITNFSRDWTTVKFNLAFANGTDVELVRKTVKKMGLDMMEEAAYKPILLEPLKMQGVVDIKDSALILRFKFTARPKNPSLVQRIAIRRMYETFPALGIKFATPTFPVAMAPYGSGVETPAAASSGPAAAPSAKTPDVPVASAVAGVAAAATIAAAAAAADTPTKEAAE
jgi:small-conductance mechanosensitive channel